MRKLDEIALFVELRQHQMLGRELVTNAAAELGIPINRAAYLLEKWESRGWYEYGVNVLCGWWTPKAPEHLDP